MVAIGAAILLLATLGVGLAASHRSWFSRAYLIVLDAVDYDGVIGNPQAPFVNRLARSFGLAASYGAIAHPAAPNLLTLVTGSAQGAKDDQPRDYDVPTFFDQLEKAGLSWRVYAQDFPGDCFTGAETTGPVDLAGDAGQYRRAYNPAISFTGIRNDPARCANITSLAEFNPRSATFEMIVANAANGMAEGSSIAAGDRFLEGIVPLITSTPDFATSVVFITWAQGLSNDGGGGRTPLLVVAPGVGPGFVSYETHTHRGLLRTLEDNWGLGCLAGSCDSNPLDEFFPG